MDIDVGQWAGIREGMEEREKWRLLRAIRDLSRVGYPYGGEADGGLAVALEEITVIAVKALKEYEEGDEDG